MLPHIVDLGPHLSPELTDRWRTLALELDGTSYFQTPDWVLGWWRTIAERPPTSLALWSDDEGKLRALVGLSRIRLRIDRRFPVSIPAIVNAGSGPGDADHCGHSSIRRWEATSPIGCSTAAADATLLLRDVDAASEGLRLPAARVVATTRCPRLHIDDGPSPIARSANFRRQLGRFERQLGRMGIEFEWIEPTGVDDVVIDALFELHGRRRATMDATSTLDARHRSLLLALLETATQAHGPAAAVARVGPRIVGVIVGFRWKDTFSAYQSGWDPSYAASSLGSVLLHQAIRMASQSGVQTFDFLRGDEPYKYRFGAVTPSTARICSPAASRVVRSSSNSPVRRRIQAFRQSRASARNRSPSRCASVNRSNRLTTRASAFDTSTREFTIVEQSLDRVGQRTRVIRFDEHPGLDGHELRYSGESCRHDRHARGHRFHEGNGDPLHPAGRVADRGEHEHVGPPELGRDLF